MSRISGSSSTLRCRADLVCDDEDDGMVRLYVKVWYAALTRRIFSGLRSVWMRLRSCRTVLDVSNKGRQPYEVQLTGYTSEELSSKSLDVCAGKRHELVTFEEVEDALT